MFGLTSTESMLFKVLEEVSFRSATEWMKEPVDSSNNDESSQRGELQVEVPELNTGDKTYSENAVLYLAFGSFSTSHNF